MSESGHDVDPRERFTATLGAYAKHRPSYPPEVVDWISTEASLAAGAVVVDLGCGTGIATRLFAERGFDVVGVDPNEAMLAEARASDEAAAGGRVRYVRGEAGATGLGDGVADLVVAAQAFHWFDLATAMPELRRVLRPGGWCAALWNVRRQTPFTTAYEALLQGLGEYRRTRKPRETMADIAAWPGVVDVRRFELEGGQRLDRAGLSGRAASSSYVAHGVADRAAFEAALDALFARFEEGGTVELAYTVTALMWRLP